MVFLQGFLNYPIYLQLWLVVLVTMNMVLPFFLKRHNDARLALYIMLAIAPIMILLAEFVGFVGLLGIVHLPWFYLLYTLIKNKTFLAADSKLRLWAQGLILINGTSLALDTRDVLVYFWA